MKITHKKIRDKAGMRRAIARFAVKATLFGTLLFSGCRPAGNGADGSATRGPVDLKLPAGVQSFTPAGAPFFNPDILMTPASGITDGREFTPGRKPSFKMDVYTRIVRAISENPERYKSRNPKYNLGNAITNQNVINYLSAQQREQYTKFASVTEYAATLGINTADLGKNRGGYFTVDSVLTSEKMIMHLEYVRDAAKRNAVLRKKVLGTPGASSEKAAKTVEEESGAVKQEQKKNPVLEARLVELRKIVLGLENEVASVENGKLGISDRKFPEEKQAVERIATGLVSMKNPEIVKNMVLGEANSGLMVLAGAEAELATVEAAIAEIKCPGKTACGAVETEKHTFREKLARLRKLVKELPGKGFRKFSKCITALRQAKDLTLENDRSVRMLQNTAGMLQMLEQAPGSSDLDKRSLRSTLDHIGNIISTLEACGSHSDAASSDKVVLEELDQKYGTVKGPEKAGKPKDTGIIIQ